MKHEADNERIGELLMQRATGLLTAPEADALATLFATLPPGEAARWEQAAAELTAALASESLAAGELIPAALAERIVGHGEAMVRSQPVVPRMVAAPVAVPVNGRRAGYGAWMGWMVAAAAVVLWLVPPRVNSDRAEVVAPVDVVAQLRDSLITRDSTTETIAWTATTDSAASGASGDVVWSGRAQRGVMRIVGLQANDRRRWQYQLWIFDKTRDQKYPVDGGVFDVPPGASDVLVAIDARVPVGDAVMFAVTVEPAGGVVVSTRERIALLAQRKS